MRNLHSTSGPVTWGRLLYHLTVSLLTWCDRDFIFNYPIVTTHPASKSKQSSNVLHACLGIIVRDINQSSTLVQTIRHMLLEDKTLQGILRFCGSEQSLSAQNVFVITRLLVVWFKMFKLLLCISSKEPTVICTKLYADVLIKTQIQIKTRFLQWQRSQIHICCC